MLWGVKNAEAEPACRFETAAGILADFRRLPILVLLILLIALSGATAGATSPTAPSAPVTSPEQLEQALDDPVGPHGGAPGEKSAATPGHLVPDHYAPSVLWALPFAGLLLSIALLPLFSGTVEWWERNSSKLVVALGFSAVTCVYYFLRPVGYHAAPGLATLFSILEHAIVLDYVPFIVLLFSLYTISGGISLRGDIPAKPVTNCAFLGVGALIASIIGTTGVAMLFIRPLLQINSERRHVRHTVIFFIFLVCNIGGCLLPVGDPPLFLGYLRGVPFTWTLTLAPPWALCLLLTLLVYFTWDSILYRREKPSALLRDGTVRRPLVLAGKANLFLLAGVVLSVAVLVPGKRLPLIGLRVPDLYLREVVQVLLALISLRITPRRVRSDNNFNFYAIAEVACLFIGIFITMQVPVEILSIRGPELGLDRPWQFFWATGMLSSFLDNAPTYIVYFEVAKTLPAHAGDVVELTRVLGTQARTIPASLLAAVSCGAVFMGANSYIGNGPNFMVRSIAEQHGVRMPSFFGYLLYSGGILAPIYLVVTYVFFV